RAGRSEEPPRNEANSLFLWDSRRRLSYRRRAGRTNAPRRSELSSFHLWDSRPRLGFHLETAALGWPARRRPLSPDRDAPPAESVNLLSCGSEAVSGVRTETAAGIIPCCSSSGGTTLHFASFSRCSRGPCSVSIGAGAATPPGCGPRCS